MVEKSRLPLPYLFLLSMRPQQWTKNLLLFAGIVFSHRYGETALLLRAGAGFALFCMLSGSIYIINDLVDLESDRLHPSKRLRPIAAGLIGRRTAMTGALLLAAAALGGAFLVSHFFFLSAMAYFGLTVLYSNVFKRVVLVDVILLALGFVVRAVAGVLAIRTEGGPEVEMTPWFVICVFFLALFVAICKRRHELVTFEQAARHRSVLGDYNAAFLDQIIAISAAATILSYALYTVAGAHNGSDNSQSLKMISTLPFVIYGVFRYLFLVYKMREGGEPDRLILKDKPLLLNTVVWLAIMVLLHKG